MTSNCNCVRFGTSAVLAFSVLAGVAGCGAPDAAFHQNVAYILRQENETGAEFTIERRQELAEVLSGMFGTPDEPSVPKLANVDVASIADVNKLRFAAGPVGRDEVGRAHGLYREHCAHCHGVTGDGAGPTASFLNPYPRDYRKGVYKFKSTPKGAKPTHEDLTRILMEGIPGTAMPSFKVLPDNEIEALVHYVRYLSIRGEVERFLVDLVALDLEPEDALFDLNAAPDARGEQASQVRDMVELVAQKWVDAESQVTTVVAPDPDRDLAASVAHGRSLFYGAIANCIKCHGETGIGDGQTTDYDDWTKELEPTKPEVLATYRDLGDFVFEPRNIRPRNLRANVFRGGRRPIDLYWRIHNGIDGTPMPAALVKKDTDPPEKKGLTQDDIWALVDYVRSLPYESISKPPVTEPAYQRERL